MSFFRYPLLAAAVAVAALPGCVTTDLTAGAEAVRVTTNADVVKGCKYLGPVRAKDRMNGGLVGEDAARENTDRKIKNQAFEMGGNVVHVQMADYGYYGASESGEVYRCEPGPG